VVNLESGDLFTRVLAGLRDLGRDVIVTVGGGIDPAELGPQPPHVHIERHIDQALVLPRCAAVVSHGGSGSVLGALAHGLPSVLLPIGADQPHNAARATELGVAVALDVMTATPAAVREAVATVLADPAYRRAAERMRVEIAALPGAESAVARLEALA
jgi:MGT family glycosyltransferase